ncbi:MAG: lipopolysaccharide biosynthesis protein [Oxalicibacterium faecigallinarum]|uniref:lipopolysaccharide biosynthesis protein n=1 Tax=Oxalicibacterium faecigallinarum TaxID=573741 RepID=UPI00280780E2|nr:lipopolysaccharide biosynthesis protein [Oxalicibacterium faecigallinarum]MDQ7969244.1 lipopolysaccharide biosynthesis protein [Oxalicibacterium faecigallinarum]
MQSGQLKTAIYRGTFWSLLDNFARQMITLLVFIVLARMLPPVLFGLLATAILIVQGFKSIAFDSISTALVRKKAPTDADYSTGFWMCLGLSLPAFLLLFVIAPYLESWTGAEGLSQVVRGVSLMILCNGLSRIHEARLTHQMDFRPLAIRSFLSVVAGGAVGIGMALNGYGVESLIAQQLVTSICEFILLWSLAKWMPSFTFSRDSFFEILHYSKYVSATALTNFANQNSDIFFVTYYLGAAASGFYATGKRITNTLNIVISTALMRVSLPAFSRLQDQDEELRRTYLHSTALTAMVTAPMFVGLAILSHDIVLVLLGEKWLPSVPVMQIITIIGFLTSVGYYNQSIMLVKNKPQWQTRLALLYAVTNVAAFMAFTRFGLIYTALAFSLRALLLFPVSVWCAITLIGVHWRQYVAGLLPSIFAAASMAVFVVLAGTYMQHLSPFVRLIALIPIGAVSYAVILYFVMPFSYRELVLKSIARYTGLPRSAASS